MEIKVTIQTEPLESWQRYRLNTILEKLLVDLQGIQYQADPDPSIDLREVKPDAQVDAEREDSAFAPGAGDVEVLRG